MGDKETKGNEIRRVKVRQDENPTIGRVIVCGKWWGKKKLEEIEDTKKKIICEISEDAKLILNNVCDSFQKEAKVKKVKYLITCGGFLQFLWPKFDYDYKPKNPPLEVVPHKVVEKLTECAEIACEKVLKVELKQKLRNVTDFFTLGVDSNEFGPFSARGEFRAGRHVEFVGLLDLRNNKYHWTRKFFPTGAQERKLVRNTEGELCTHFVELDGERVMILGCHDLNVFNRRGAANDNPEGWRRQIRETFIKRAKREKPTILLQHPHHTEKITTWIDATNNMSRLLKVKAFASAGRYDSKGKKQLTKVLNVTKIGNTIDFIVDAR